jgi:hypothetical protein
MNEADEPRVIGAEGLASLRVLLETLLPYDFGA